MLVLSPQAFGVNSIAFGDNSKAYGVNSKGYGDRIHPYKKV
ncbi:left-handed beta-roll domain-containing protein [Phocaeicola dorei]|nr:left-handed beta-roll domain-containing protein [Phocaeicola dorei]MCE9456455.1 left-handed beta-roll domain-containing protein [Phocaeicola dorei]